MIVEPPPDEPNSTYDFRAGRLCYYPPDSRPGQEWEIMVRQRAYFGDDLWPLPLNWCVIQL